MLKSLSEHYQDKTKELSYKMIDAMIKTRLTNVGLNYLRQILFSKFDMTLHTCKKDREGKDWTSESLVAYWRDLKKELMGLEEAPGTFRGNTFGHIVGGCEY